MKSWKKLDIKRGKTFFYKTIIMIRYDFKHGNWFKDILENYLNINWFEWFYAITSLLSCIWWSQPYMQYNTHLTETITSDPCICIHTNVHTYTPTHTQLGIFITPICHTQKVTNRSTCCGLVIPYDSINLSHHCFRKWLVAWRHQAIAWINSLRQGDTYMCQLTTHLLSIERADWPK